jgi:hypothetical protein
MSKISQIRREEKVIEVGGIEIAIRELPAEYIEMLMEQQIAAANNNIKEFVRLTHEIVSITIKESIPDATDNEIKSCIGSTQLFKILLAIQEVNGDQIEFTPEQREKLDAARRRAQAAFAKKP